MSARGRVLLGLAVAFAVLEGGPLPSARPGQAADALSPGRGPRGVSRSARDYFTDVVLVNQHGRALRLYSDLLQGKVVVINTFYGDCTDVCPIIMRTFARIQDDFGPRLGKDVHLLSLTVDPERDTPSRLKAYAERLQARPGWHFLTGKKENVDFAARKLGHYVDARERHLNVVIAGNERTGLWKKLFGLAAPEALVALVQGVADDP